MARLYITFCIIAAEQTDPNKNNGTHTGGLYLP